TARDQRDAAHCAEHDPPLRHRSPHNASLWLWDQPTHPKERRGGLGLEEDDRRNRKEEGQRSGKGRLDLSPRSRRLQPDPPAEAHGGDMNASVACQLFASGRITPARIWHRDHLDLSGRPTLSPAKNRRREFALGLIISTAC